METKEDYSWLIKPKKVELNKGLNICSQGYENEDEAMSESRKMSRKIDAMMEEAKRIETATREGRRPPIDKAATTDGGRPMTTGQLYDELKSEQSRMKKINKRDHLSEMWSIMKYNTKPPTSSYRDFHSFCDEMKSELVNQDKSHHIKQDKIFKHFYKR